MKRFFIFGISVIALALVVLTSQPLLAAGGSQALCQGSGGTWTVDNQAPNGGVCNNGNKTVMGVIQNITDVIVYITGAVSVLMIIIGGLRYTLSGGDQAAMTSAKNTILYSIIGLLVAIMAYAIVHFVIVALGIK